jgi:TolA-binding protein
MSRARPFVTFAWLAVSVAASTGQTPQADEAVARRQLESGRSFARQGNYPEALKDFRAVAETHASTTVADNALLEIARYYFDVAGDFKEAGSAVDAILKRYATSDSAPDAYVLAGRLALARSRQAVDLEAALANFDRVSRLFPEADAVPRSLLFAGETLWYARRFDDALVSFARLAADYPATMTAAEAHLGAGRTLVSLGDPILAMEELQQARNRWPNAPAAQTALAQITLLHRLYVRARSGPAFALSAETAGPAKVQDVSAVAATPRAALYWAGRTGVGIVTPASAERPPAAAGPRGLAVDTAGKLVVIDGGQLRSTGSSQPLALYLPRPNGPEPLEEIDAAVQLSNGDWLVMDGGERAIHRFSRAGAYIGPFAAVRVSRLAVNAVDEIGGIDRDQRSIVLFDAAGKLTSRIPLRGTGYDLRNPEDLTFDAFGHLYVLDRVALAVFSPYAARAQASAATTPAGTSARTAGYALVTVFAPMEKDPDAFRRATAFALDPSGAAFIYDDRAQRILVYR